MKAAILAIGTELVDGQIVNKNAAWISKQLKDIGLQSSLHLAVPDERELILEALDFCVNHGDLIFVTGGLGPTSDDFTRDIISEWTKSPLKFDEASWLQIKERLEPRGFTVKEIQRQQCYFPEGSQILKNLEGTANAFFMETQNKKFFILPGPPREIEAVWNFAISDWLKTHTKNLDPAVTRSWDTLGIGESDIALIVEEALQGIEVEKGYRVHLPYVEVKISYPKSQEQKYKTAVEKLTEALSHCLVTRDQQDVPELLALALKKYSSLSIQDSVTGTYLFNRLTPVTREFIKKNTWSFSNSAIDDSAQLKLFIEHRDEHSCWVILEKGGQRMKDILEAPYKSPLMSERRLQYFAELAMIFWLRHI
jgi:molybdenum cofactor synthesis domain-containing protein